MQAEALWRGRSAAEIEAQPDILLRVESDLFPSFAEIASFLVEGDFAGPATKDFLVDEKSEFTSAFLYALPAQFALTFGFIRRDECIVNFAGDFIFGDFVEDFEFLAGEESGGGHFDEGVFTFEVAV